MNSLLGKHWHHLPENEVLNLLETNIQKGLDIFEIKHRQDRFGLNVLTPKKEKSALVRFLHQFNNPLMIILLVASLVTAIMKDPIDAAVIFGVVLVNAVIGYIQEAQAQKSIAALAKTMTTEAVVIRSGNVIRLPASELVPGDIVQLLSGARVPADLRLLASRDLQVTEAALTGESHPVEKDASLIVKQDTVLAERRNMAYASTLVTFGSATGVVVATGDDSEVGRISQLISSAAELETPLTRKIGQFSRVLLVAILILAAITFGIGILRGQPALDTFMVAVALAVGAIPEGLPAAITVTLAIGVSRMARRRAIIRNLPAVETLGSTTVICSDKTGTLTQNQMTVKKIYTLSGVYDVSGVGYQPDGEISGDWTNDAAVIETLKAGFLCNDSQLVEKEGQWAIQGDPTEGALLVVARKGSLNLDNSTLPARVDSIPFDSRHQYMATLHEDGTVYIKGAAEVLLDLCTGALDPSGNVTSCNSNEFRQALETITSQGLRVLAFARLDKPGAKKINYDTITDLTLLGLQGMIDPPRAEVLEAIRVSQQAGIIVKMITGDHALTAAAIGRQIGLCQDDCSAVLTGAELSRLSDAELIEQAEKVNVFARVAPEQKLRLVEALQARNQVVAMTGDGVNDAPALKQANIGIAMGITGTDVSKEASDMILTDDNFNSIEAAIEEGRGVYDNLIKFIVWTLPTNLGEGLVLLAAIVIGATLPILPIQILWINMVTVAVLGISLSLEAKEPGLMRRKPRNPKAPILDGVLIWRIVLVSLIILAGAFGLFEYELGRGSSLAEARTVAVNVVIFVEMFYLFNARSLTLSPFQLGFFSNWWSVGGAILMVLIQLLFTYAPFMNIIFYSAPISLLPWLGVLIVSVAAYIIIEVEKWFRRKLNAGIK
ncbi:MAG: cation-transporting P-type ATPase [Anaerolineales bacterium]|nr:cation-transporting P-type ATPase [Anaerolineales bacterium]